MENKDQNTKIDDKSGDVAAIRTEDMLSLIHI